MRNAVQLITYVDRLGGDIGGLTSLLDGELADLFGGVHLLPYFTPFDGADAGFDPSDHTLVDSRLGDWESIRTLSERMFVMSDLIVNHVSSESRQFQDVRRTGEKSDYWDFFLKREDVFPTSASERELEKIYRPRPGLPFTTVRFDNRATYDFWSTFSPQQLDINVESAAGRAYLESIFERFAGSGIKAIRLDAVGYAVKRRGTNCFMLPETFEFIDSLRSSAADLGMDSLVELHSHHQTQIDIADRVSWVYDFALPPLVLHSIYCTNTEALKKWFAISPRNCVTVLDTHDGIGIVDVASDSERPGLLTDSQIEALVDQIGDWTDGQSRSASGKAASNLDIYQVNTTFYDAVGRSDNLYLLARAIQFFAPGVPQVYYMGLLAEGNDMDLLQRTGVGRDINRHYFDKAEIAAAVRKPVVQSLFALIRLRNSASGFQGDFDMPDCRSDQLCLRWQFAEASIELFVDLTTARGVITRQENGVLSQYIVTDSFDEVPAADIRRIGK